MAAKKKKGPEAWKAKKWYAIVAPKAFEEKQIGETVSAEPGLLADRVVSTTLRELTGNISQQHVQLHFRVKNVAGDRAETEIDGHEIHYGYLMRQLKRMHSVVKLVAPVTTQDGVRMMLTVISYGRTKMTLDQKTQIRKITAKYLESKAAATPLDRFYQELVFGKASSDIFKEVKRIYPVTKAEIVKSRVMREAKQEA
jgi:small subunit ribosomal protein S3Ae